MNYENRTVCFFDILGFSNIVKNEILDAKEITQLFLEITLIINEYKYDNIQCTYFSDSIVISIGRPALSTRQLKLITEILIKFLKYKLVARGAMVYGKVIHTSEFIFGPALVRAALLEKESKFPRIILDQSLDEEFLPTRGNTQIKHRNFYNDYMFVKKDETDGHYYVDLIGEIRKKQNSKELIDILNHLVVDGLKSKDQKIIEKYKWLKEKMS
ncbi:MAG TPA: hypothetical protein VK766_03130 [Cytophagaceae bacterium]|jgi:hypothetical protein|nr:hypothetical protein [Cytophagaceae bacterium]